MQYYYTIKLILFTLEFSLVTDSCALTVLRPAWAQVSVTIKNRPEVGMLELYLEL
jgi:hypothetical protein